MMKKKSMLIVSALLTLLLTGCSQQELDNDLAPEDGAKGKEIRLVFSGGGESQEYTRAIASESENQIDNLDIYVFAAAASDGDYQYLETWKAAANDDTNSKTFKLSGAGTQRKASIFPTELKGIPYLKLYCVANSTTLYKADGTGMDALTPVTTNAATGTIDGPGTKAEEFEKLCIAKLDPAGTALGTPLVMTGSGTTKILGNIATVNIELKRRVSRFDIDNESAKTGLIIESVSLGNGRNIATVMNSTLAELTAPERATGLIKYPATDGSFQMLPKANQGLTESALYTYPLAATDKAFLIIKGKYQNPTQKDPVPVEYHLDIKRVPDGMTDPAFMDVEANTRYTLHIKEVMEATITAFFEIVDWTSGGGVIIKPDNAAPVVTKMEVEGTDVPDLTTTEIKVTADGAEKTIVLTATASGKVQPKFSTPTAWSIDWLTHDDTAYKTEIVDGVTTTTMTFKYTLTDSSPYAPVTLTLANESASQDESVYTKLTIVPPATAPVLNFATPDAATGNFNRYDLANNKLTMYKTRQSTITLGASCPFGTKLELSANVRPWLEVAKSKTGPTPGGAGTDVTVATPVEEFYTLKLKDATATSNGESKFNVISLGDATKSLELAVELLDPAITAIVLDGTPPAGVAYADNKITSVPRTGGTTVEVKITSPQGVTASTLSSWFTVAETSPFTRTNPTDATGDQTFSLTVKDNVTDFTDAPIVLKSNIAGVDDVTVLVSPAAVATP